MNDSLRDIRQYVSALSARERFLLIGRVALQTFFLLVALLLALVVAAWLRIDHGLAAILIVGLAGAGLWAAIVAPLVVAWRRTGDLLRQARLAEGLRPELEGRLITAVERLDGVRGQESEAIVGLVARRAWERVASLRPGRVHRSWPLAAMAGGLVVATLATLITALVAPGGIAGTWRFWTQTGEALAAADVSDHHSADNARVGDLVLEYIYPTYTGLEPLQVTNSTGEAHGPPGTQVRVRARSADPIDGGAVVAYDEPSPDSTVSDRIIEGSFTIGDTEGVWRLDLLLGEATRTSREFPITPEPDLPPEVMVDAPSRMEVALDAPLALPWQVRDDYGLSKVVLIVDGKEERQLREIADGRPDADGIVGFTPAQLGMSAGMVVELQIGAWDNNGWAGPQLGVNEPPIRLEVKNAEDLLFLGMEERKKLRDELVDLLADQLVDPWPPPGSSASVARSGERFDGFYAEVKALLEATPAIQRDRMVRRMVRRVVRSGQDFVTYTQVNFDPRLRDAPTTADERQRASDLRARAGELRELAIEENEHTIVWLDRFIQMNALGETTEEAEALARLGAQLQRALERGASDAEIQSALDRVERSLEKLGEAVSSMDQDSTRSMVERRARELALMRETVSAAQASGDREEAAEMAARMARQMKELNEDLQYRLRALEDEEDELGQEMKDLMEELQRLEREQRKLQEDVRQVRASGDAQGAAEAERLWSQVETLAREAEERGLRMEKALEQNNGMYMFEKRVEAGREASGRLAESAAARDLRKAQRDAQEAMARWARARTGVPEGARRQVTRRLEQAQRLLDQLDRDASSVDPRTAAQARALEGRQNELDQSLRAAREQAQQVAAKMPIEPRGMTEALERADQSMDHASEDLGQGRPMPAEGAQGQAAERIKEAREALEQAAAEMASSGGQAREPGELEGKGDEPEGSDPVDLDLDNPAELGSPDLTLEEEFDLDAFQRDVLRGARGDVPEAYRAMKKRYYEELMTQ